MDGRGTDGAEVTRRRRLASTTTAVALASLTVLLLAVDVPLQAQIQTLSPSSTRANHQL